MKASELKKGAVVTLAGGSYLVRDIQVKAPSSRSGNTLYRVLFRNVLTRQKLEQTFKGEDVLTQVELSRRPVQLLFAESDSCTFMDQENFEQYTIDNDALENELSYLAAGVEGIYALIVEGSALGIELPSTLALEISDCAPAIKGGSASARSKPATLSTGLVVQVPEYITAGERVRVNTTTGTYVSRA